MKTEKEGDGEAVVMGCLALVKVGAFFVAVVCLVGACAPIFGWWISGACGSVLVYFVMGYTLQAYEREKKAAAKKAEGA